jgi:hypothetical protein
VDQKSKLAYRDILAGYSTSEYLREPIYLKHISVNIDLDSECSYIEEFDRAKNMGLPTESDRLQSLEESEEWTKKDESTLISDRNFLENLHKTHSKLIIDAQKAQVKKTIQDTEEKIKKASERRSLLIGSTCETFANKKKSDWLIKKSVFKDKGLSIPLLSDEEDWDDATFRSAEFLFYLDSVRFSEKILKDISVSPYFYNYFVLTDKENCYKMFADKPTDITLYQQRILTMARRIRSIFENFDVPDEKSTKYDDIVDFYEFTVNKKSKGPKDSNGYSIVGASKQELEKLGLGKTALTPLQLLQKKGKTRLTKEDFAT